MKIIQPTLMFYLSQEIQEEVLDWSVEYQCQRWLKKLIVPYLYQYQTFLVMTAISEYTMPVYY